MWVNFNLPGMPKKNKELKEKKKMATVNNLGEKKLENFFGETRTEKDKN